MSGTGDEQLIELLLYLKKTTPDAARAILNGQPQIAYALVKLMANMGALDTEVVTRNLSHHGIPTGPSESVGPVPLVSTSHDGTAATPAGQPGDYSNHGSASNYAQSSAVGAFPHSSGPQAATIPSSAPTYLDSSASNVSSSPTPPYPQQYAPPYQAPAAHAGNRFSQPPAGYGSGDSGYSSRFGGPTPMPAAPGYGPPPTVVPEILANVPPEQKALLARVMSMTPAEINRLPPAERANVLQLRVTLGLPSS